MAWTLMIERDNECGWPDIPVGYQLRTRFHVKSSLRGRHQLPYSLSAHDKAWRCGPVPLPFKHKRRKR